MIMHGSCQTQDSCDVMQQTTWMYLALTLLLLNVHCLLASQIPGTRKALANQIQVN
jgi:hypothetical protein